MSGQQITAVRPRFYYIWNISVDPQSGVFEFKEPSGRLLAACVDFESILAAHRLLTGAAQ